MPPIPVGVQKLAAQLARRMPWLARKRHIGALVRLLHRHRLDASAGWTAEQVLHALERHNRIAGQTVLAPVTQRNPLGYLHTLLTAARPELQAQVQPVEERPEAAWRIEDRAKQRALAAEDRALRAAAIAKLREAMRGA